MCRIRWAAAATALAAASPAAAQDVTPSLVRAAAVYDTVVSLRAEFVQTINNPMVAGVDTTSGILLLRRPAEFALRFARPPGDRVVVDGTWLWLYLPSSAPEQVLRQPAPRGGAASPNLFAQFVDRPQERYEVEHRGTVTLGGVLHDILRLVPREPEAPFRTATIAVGRSDGLIRRLDIVEHTGQRRILVLRELSINVEIPPAEFQFSPLPGTRVIDQK